MTGDTNRIYFFLFNLNIYILFSQIISPSDIFYKCLYFDGHTVAQCVRCQFAVLFLARGERKVRQRQGEEEEGRIDRETPVFLSSNQMQHHPLFYIHQDGEICILFFCLCIKLCSVSISFIQIIIAPQEVVIDDNLKTNSQGKKKGSPPQYYCGPFTTMLLWDYQTVFF